MKVRKSLVSNSSSTSFTVIATPRQFEEMLSNLKLPKEKMVADFFRRRVARKILDGIEIVYLCIYEGEDCASYSELFEDEIEAGKDFYEAAQVYEDIVARALHNMEDNIGGVVIEIMR